jgi:PAS domain S-box-containing protein
MLLGPRTVDHMIDVAVDAASAGDGALGEVLNRLPAAIYVTDAEGVVTFYNDACVALAGRVPAPGRDKWCVTWKLFTTEGDFLPHDACPMAVAIRERRPIRGVEAIAERPDGTTVHFEPYPTPLFDEAGNLAGAVNLLLDVTDRRTRAYFEDQAARCRRLAKGVGDGNVAETLLQMASRYEEQGAKASRLH